MAKYREPARLRRAIARVRDNLKLYFDVLVSLDAIRVGAEFRKPRDVEALMAQIRAGVGLIPVVTLTTDYRLLSGRRTLEACRRLGWTDIPAVIDESPSLSARELSQAMSDAGHEGGLVGGKARATKMSPDERRDQARRAALARWRRSTG